MAMIYIIAFHWFGRYWTGDLALVANAGAQGNHIFFILSAFGLTLALSRKANSENRQDWNQWFSYRAKKILIPYYISVILIVGFILLYGYVSGDVAGKSKRMNLNFDTVLSTVFLYRNFIGGHSTAINTPWWFAITILQFYLLFPILYGVLRKFGWKAVAISSFAINAGYIFFYAVILGSTNNAFNCFPLRFIFSFSSGIILCHFFLKDGSAFSKMLTGIKPVIAGIALEVVGIYLSLQGDVGKAFNELFFGPGVFVLTFNFLHWLSSSHFISRFVRLIGEYSLPLFLLHAPFIYILFPANLPAWDPYGLINFLLYVAFLIPLTWSVSKFIFDKIDNISSGQKARAFAVK